MLNKSSIISSIHMIKFDFSIGKKKWRRKGYLSNRCVRVEFIALSTVAIASTIDVCTKGSPFRLTLGTIESEIHMLLQKCPHTKRYFYKTESRHDIISVV